MITKTLVSKTENFHVDFNNDFKCNLSTTFNKKDNSVSWTSSFFSKKYKKMLCYLPDSVLDILKTTHWSEHFEIIENNKSLCELNFNIETIDTFVDFDKLYYVGCSLDGMLIHAKTNTFISTPIRFDECYCQIYQKIETSKKECQKIIDNFNPSFIIDSSIKEIPYYNQNEDMDDHFTLCVNSIFPQEIYVDVINKHNSTYVSDIEKNEFFKILSSK